jgi:NAD(P)-dependent dehydrogenase (short-subunit alcohol dehydrogenase family)
VAVYNASTLVMKPAVEITGDEFRELWEVCCLGGFLTGREAARHMIPRGRGTIFFTGSREARRGFAGFSAHCSGKFALRGLAQSMARELGPQGIHVAHMMVDGLIDSPHTRQFLEGRIDLPDVLMNPDHIADSYWSVYEQPRDAWTFETDLRPFDREW